MLVNSPELSAYRLNAKAGWLMLIDENFNNDFLVVSMSVSFTSSLRLPNATLLYIVYNNEMTWRYLLLRIHWSQNMR